MSEYYDQNSAVYYPYAQVDNRQAMPFGQFGMTPFGFGGQHFFHHHFHHHFFHNFPFFPFGFGGFDGY